jgi:uncharacterized protein YbjQ (UPF0145 family)
VTEESPQPGLPPVAEARMNEIRGSGTWGSALTTDEFAAIKSTGFEAVGQVLGAAVFNIGYRGYGCPAWGSSYNFGFGNYGATFNAGTATSGGGQNSAYAPLVRTLYEARRTALGRMTAECQELGGHGVVGVRLTIGPFPAGGLEFKAIGTAIRSPGSVPLRTPFSSDLSGQDFAKLITSGWVPAGLVLGIAIGARHDDWTTVSQTSWGAGNTEVSGYTDLINVTRHDARIQLERDVARHGADGVVVQDMTLRVGEHECPVQEGRRDHLAEATIIVTAIVHFGKPKTARPPLAIMSLDPQRRQAARVKLGP